LKPSAQRQLRSQQEKGVSITRKTGLARETALLDSVSRIVTVRWPFHVLTCV
jgi:transposase